MWKYKETRNFGFYSLDPTINFQEFLFDFYGLWWQFYYLISLNIKIHCGGDGTQQLHQSLETFAVERIKDLWDSYMGFRKEGFGTFLVVEWEDPV